jgi:hypothetical protein
MTYDRDCLVYRVFFILVKNDYFCIINIIYNLNQLEFFVKNNFFLLESIFNNFKEHPKTRRQI